MSTTDPSSSEMGAERNVWFLAWSQVSIPPNSADCGGARPPLLPLEVGLLGQDQGVVDLDAEIANCALQLGVAE